MPSYLITGASRGLGLGYTAELLKDKNNFVIATARNTAASKGLQELKTKYGETRLALVDLDLSKPESVHAAAEKAGELLPNGLDHLISNAGVSLTGLEGFDTINLEDFQAEVSFTITAPVVLYREFLPLIRKGTTKKILQLTSILGSIQIGGLMPGLANGYSVSRAALNMLVRKWAPALKSEGITVALINPGWVDTDMGDGITPWMSKHRPDAKKLTPEESTVGCMKVLHDLKLEDAGEYFSHDGTKLPW